MRRTTSVWIGIALILGGVVTPSRVFAPVRWQDWQPATVWEREESSRLEKMMAPKIEALIRPLGESGQFNGSVIVAHQGHTIYKEAFGYADFSGQELLSPSHSLQLASVSKMFTATAVLLLAQDGQLDLDDAIQCHIPEWPYADMTIRHLLTHRSGLSRYMAVASWYWEDYKQPLSNEEVIQQYAEHKPVTFFTPDHGFNYCNTNYVVLASLVERVSGQSFPDFMQTWIFDPLGMENAYIYAWGSRESVPQTTYGHKAGRRGYYHAYQDYIDGVWGDKNLYASVEDLLKFDRALWEGTLVSQYWLDQAWDPGSPERRYNYGFGWRLMVQGDQTIPYHFGWWRGYRTCFIRDPETGLSLILLMNVDRSLGKWSYWDLFKKIKAWYPLPGIV